MFQRIWSDKDEIKLLQGMVEFLEEKKLRPMANVGAFKDFLHKKSVRFGFLANESQIYNKMRKMKVKFTNGCETGRIWRKPHDQKVAELSHVLWGGDGKTSKTPDGAGKVAADLPESPVEFEDGDWASVSSQLQLSSTGLEQKVLRIGMGMIGSSEIEELKEKWRQLRMSELQVDNDRAMLVNHQATLIMDGYRRADRRCRK
ncbi:probable transcription factor At4g00390 [Rhodamnia argentea]|uniref:Probable transcription factor At4g00390 n=1 Tax=Rhodamnia argentea TaxID=178133 RepID=A0A8B8R212_9MYRT|nr:probable transcription factor At4g00390 [Rhodamnia argentea]